MSPRERIASARLYLVSDARPRAFLDAALRGGVDLVQLRDKTLDDDGIVAAARDFRADSSVADARAAVGPDRIVGRSTHTPEQGAAADADPDVDYFAVGPVHATPTKPGRRPAGLEYVSWAASHAMTPWFAIGGIDVGNVRDVAVHGAHRIVVVRAITHADDPEAAARALRAGLEAPLGAAQP
jgi:thiamine-phosphate pyrophosphorylase